MPSQQLVSIKVCSSQENPRSHSAGAPKSCLQSSVVGHHLNFLSVSNKSAQSTCQNDSSKPSARRKCPGTHSRRTNHFGFGSVTITSCNEIPEPHAAHVRHIHISHGAQGTDRRLSRICRGKYHHSMAFPGREDGIALQS